MATAEELTKQLTVTVIAAVADQDLTGPEKLEKVCEFVSTFDDSVIGLNFIPNALEAKILAMGIENIQEFIKGIDVKEFVQTNYNRVKYALKKIFHKA